MGDPFVGKAMRQNWTTATADWIQPADGVLISTETVVPLGLLVIAYASDMQSAQCTEVVRTSFGRRPACPGSFSYRILQSRVPNGSRRPGVGVLETREAQVHAALGELMAELRSERTGFQSITESIKTTRGAVP